MPWSRIAAALCLGSFLAVLFLAVRSATALDVGVASREIAPNMVDHKVPLAGYGARQGRPSTGVHDPLWG